MVFNEFYFKNQNSQKKLKFCRSGIDPGGPRGAWEPRGSPEALDKSPGVVFHAEFEFRVKTTQNITKMDETYIFLKILIIFLRRMRALDGWGNVQT